MKNLNFINKIKNKSGFSPIIIAVIVAAVLLAAGAIYYFVAKKPLEGGGAKGVEKSLEELKVEAPELDISFSPLPQLNVSSLNLSFPQLPSGNVFSGFSVDTNFSYQGNLNISVPNVQLEIPTGASQQQPFQQQQQGQVNAANCSQFAAIPGAQYCSMVGYSSGVTLCQQCKAAGF